jgi:HD-GYP domain-containing protein (c-di-GMP phosphodiesterase class II)
MEKMLLNDVCTGDVIAKDIYNSSGVMLIPKGTVFSDRQYMYLEEVGINEVFIEDDEQVDIDVLENYQKKLHIDDIIYEKTRIQAQKQIKKTMIRLGAMSRINVSEINALIENIIEQLFSQKDLILTLSRLRSIDNYTYEHSVNVCILSLIVGIDFNLDKGDLKSLGIGAILHDIGKVAISEDILKKPSKLTSEEFKEIEKHTNYGYEIIINSNIAEKAAHIALYHHEKYDGTGYNESLKGKAIPFFSRIVAIADVYDAISNDRVYKRKMAPDKAYKEIIRSGDSHFDVEVMEKFIRHLSLYPVGTGVVLNTNHKGIVINQNKHFPQSPIIRLIRKDNINAKLSYVDIDLSTTHHLFIKDTF